MRTAQNMKLSIKDFFSKCDQIRSFLRIWTHLLKKSLTGNFIFLYSDASVILILVLCSDASVILLLVLRVTQSLKMTHSSCSQFFEINRQIYLYVCIDKVKPPSRRFCHTCTTMYKWTSDTFKSFKK